MASAPAIAVLAAVLAAGCVNYIETVHARVRDPAAVAVSIDTPAGHTQLLAAASGSAGAAIPPTEPPYREAEQPGAIVVRYERDALAALCSWCARQPGRPLVGADGAITLTGTPDQVLARSGEQLHMRFDYEVSLRCHHRRGECERPAFVLELDTPRDNVLDLRFERHVSTRYGELTGAKLGLVAGVVAALVGGSLMAIAVGDHGLHGGRWDVAGGGAIGLGVSAVFLGTSIATLRARDSDTAIPLQ
jgi:hypothetical protein